MIPSSRVMLRLRDVSKYRYSHLTKGKDYCSRSLALSTLALAILFLFVALGMLGPLVCPDVSSGLPRTGGAYWRDEMAERMEAMASSRGIAPGLSPERIRTDTAPSETSVSPTMSM